MAEQAHSRRQDRISLTSRFPEIPQYSTLARKHFVDAPQASAFLPSPHKFSVVEVLLGIVLVLIRVPIVLLLVSLTVVYCLALIAGLTEKDFNPKTSKPLSQWRQFLLSLVPCRLLLWLCGFYSIDVSMSPKVAGKAYSSTPFIVVSNHVCFMETFMVFWIFHPSFVAKKSVRSIPLFGFITVAAQSFFLDRDDPNSRTTVRDEIIRRANWKGDGEFHKLLLFPEATVSNGNQLITFSGGAFNPGVPVLPVCVIHPTKNSTDKYFGGGHQPMALVMLKTLMTWRNEMHMRVLDPYAPSDEEKQDPQLFANNVRAYMAREMNLPTTDHSQVDVQLLIEHLKVDPHMKAQFSGSPLADFGDLLLRSGSLIKVLSKGFRDIAREDQARVTRSEFLRHYATEIGVPETDVEKVLATTTVAAELFDQLAVHNGRDLVLQEYVVGFLCLLNVVSRRAESWRNIVLSHADAETEIISLSNLAALLRKQSVDADIYYVARTEAIAERISSEPREGGVHISDFDTLQRRNPLLAVVLLLGVK